MLKRNLVTNRRALWKSCDQYSNDLSIVGVELVDKNNNDEQNWLESLEWPRNKFMTRPEEVGQDFTTAHCIDALIAENTPTESSTIALYFLIVLRNF